MSACLIVKKLRVCWRVVVDVAFTFRFLFLWVELVFISLVLS